MKNFLEFMIKKFIGVEDLPTENKINDEIVSLRNSIENMVNNNCRDSDHIFSLYDKLRIMNDILLLRRRIDSGISTVIYFIYTIFGSVVGISLAIGVFFTTTGNVGHILLLLSILGSVVSITIGVKSIMDERAYLLYLIENIKGKA